MFHYLEMCATIVRMTEARVPIPTMGDRMRLALRHSDLGVQEMADYLGVSRNAASTWLNDRIRPGKQTLRLWAMRTEVPLEWLETGEVRHVGLEPTTRCLPPNRTSRVAGRGLAAAA